MNYTEEMLLTSKSGYCMPFEEKKGDVHLCLGYGEQTHPKTKEAFFHHGVDFVTHRYMLASVGDGVVTGISTDTTHGLQIALRHGKYEVVYGHLANVLVTFGTRVSAGDVVGVSGDLLHMEVRYDGKEIDPVDFLTMLFGNVQMMMQQGRVGTPDFETIDMDIPTDYDDDRDEIEGLMLRYYPEYLMALRGGNYVLPIQTEQSLRNIFSVAAIKSYFYETLPSLANPLGVGSRAMPIAAKVQNLLIGDFLNYLALQHDIFLSSLSDARKKKALMKPSSSKE